MLLGQSFLTSSGSGRSTTTTDIWCWDYEGMAGTELGTHQWVDLLGCPYRIHRKLNRANSPLLDQGGVHRTQEPVAYYSRQELRLMHSQQAVGRDRSGVMRKIGLMALLVTLATPAWAANDEKPQEPSWQVSNSEATNVCMQFRNAGRHLRHEVCADGGGGARSAKHILMRCTGRPDTDCPASRAYIKQRWGY